MQKFQISPLKDACLARAWAAVKQPKPNDTQGLPSRTWAAIPLRTRSILAMLGGTSMDDPREVARRPWESFSNADKLSIAACARELSKSLNDASCLF
jgi:hypothetical protein